MFINGLYINAQRVGLRLCMYMYNPVKCNGCIHILMCVGSGCCDAAD